MASLSLKKIYKKYDNGFCAVTDFNLEVADKEFVVFVVHLDVVSLQLLE